MGAPDIDTALDWRGRTVVDRDGEKIGTLREIYLDQDDRPGWASVHTALFGLRETIVPLTDARRSGEDVQVPHEREHVKQAPNVDPDVQLSEEDEEQLYRHYGIATANVADRTDVGAGPEREGAVTAELAEPGPQQASAVGRQDPDVSAAEAPAGGVGEGTDDAMTRSEEEVTVGTRRRVRGRVRLKKYVVTDYVEKKIPVRREEVRLEHEPATGDEPPSEERA